MPYHFTNPEYRDLHYIYGFCDGNAAAAVREYGRRFPNRHQPHRSVFTRVNRQIGETGTVTPPASPPGPIRDAEVAEVIEEHFNETPRTSTRRAALELDIPRASIIRTLKTAALYPFHFTPVQNLLPLDFHKRLQFCEWFINQRAEIRAKILWTDESTFTRNGIFNFHNEHYWADANPHLVMESSFQHQFKVNVWAGMIHDKLIGPHFLPPIVNAANFLQFLLDDLPGLMEDVPLNRRENSWFQLDGCPAHYANVVVQWLDQHYPGRWIGRQRGNDEHRIVWPPRSPDLTPLDFYLWGTVKEKVYATRVDTREELMERISTVFQELKGKPLEIKRATRSVVNRCRKCQEENGGHIENKM